MIAVLLSPVIAGGCQWLPSRPPATAAVPQLSMSLSCSELVDFLNQQHDGLSAMRCTDTRVTVRMPGGMRTRLSGHLACQAPGQFRLTASGVLSRADLGANEERCWFYVQPGDGNVLTWRHEDAGLLEQFAVGVPRIDPEWLLQVLGVVPLDEGEFELRAGPAGSRELWLTSVTDNYDGLPLRRVTKVDTTAGLIREHVIYDHQRNPLIRATIRSHKKFDGHLLPQSLVVSFPAMDTDLELQFGSVRTNCAIDRSLWELPGGQANVVDLGDVVRQRVPPPGHGHDTAQITDRKWTPDHSAPSAPDFDMDGTTETVPLQPDADPSPVWDLPSAYGSRSPAPRMGLKPRPPSGWRPWPFRR